MTAPIILMRPGEANNRLAAKLEREGLDVWRWPAFTIELPAETDRLHEAGAEGVAVFTAGRYLLTEQFRLNEQDLLALFERHGYDLVLLEGFGDSGWAKIEVVRSSVSPVGTAFQPMAIVGDVPGADFALDDPAALADWIENQMPSL